MWGVKLGHIHVEVSFTGQMTLKVKTQVPAGPLNETGQLLSSKLISENTGSLISDQQSVTFILVEQDLPLSFIKTEYDRRIYLLFCILLIYKNLNIGCFIHKGLFPEMSHKTFSKILRFQRSVNCYYL